jgi:4-hydroxy 2-oxovalerate aldolase
MENKDVRILDATIRDGGLVNSFFFTDEFIKNLYETNVKAGIDYMEFGYKASKDLFDESKFGAWKFCKEDDIYKIVGDNKTDLKIACMADVGRCDFKRDITSKANSPIDMFRIATYIDTIPEAVEMIEHCHNLGYETTCNIMAISTSDDEKVKVALDELSKSSVDGIYLVDSYGSLYPEDVRRLAEIYVETATKSGKFIGMHAHNNQQLAFGNTIEAFNKGVLCLDATMSGMGRGAGNCMMEMILGYLKNKNIGNYDIKPVIDFIENNINVLKANNVVWGYDTQYLMTGQLNLHPRDAIAFTDNDRKDYVDFYETLLSK